MLARNNHNRRERHVSDNSKPDTDEKQAPAPHVSRGRNKEAANKSSGITAELCGGTPKLFPKTCC